MLVPLSWVVALLSPAAQQLPESVSLLPAGRLLKQRGLQPLFVPPAVDDDLDPRQPHVANTPPSATISHASAKLLATRLKEGSHSAAGLKGHNEVVPAR